MKHSSRDFEGDSNSAGDCVLCSSMLEDGKCGVCGVDQAEAKAIIRDVDQGGLLELCEMVETSDRYDAKTKSLFRRLAEVIPGRSGSDPRKGRLSPFRIWKALRADGKRSAKLLAMTNVDYQQLICRAYQTTAIHTAQEEMRRYLIPSAAVTFGSVALARWLTEGLLWQVFWWPLLAVALMAVLGMPVEYALNRFARPMKRAPDVAEIPWRLNLAVSQRVPTPFYLRANFWWPTMLVVTVIVVGQF